VCCRELPRGETVVKLNSALGDDRCQGKYGQDGDQFAMPREARSSLIR
jgi:hypothetical protein